jgi:hypothetical protein
VKGPQICFSAVLHKHDYGVVWMALLLLPDFGAHFALGYSLG